MSVVLMSAAIGCGIYAKTGYFDFGYVLDTLFHEQNLFTSIFLVSVLPFIFFGYCFGYFGGLIISPTLMFELLNILAFMPILCGIIIVLSIFRDMLVEVQP